MRGPGSESKRESASDDVAGTARSDGAGARRERGSGCDDIIDEQHAPAGDLCCVWPRRKGGPHVFAPVTDREFALRASTDGSAQRVGHVRQR